MKATIKPFNNESQSYTISSLIMENRLDKISMFGSIDIEKTQQGLEIAELLKSEIDLIVATLRELRKNGQLEKNLQNEPEGSMENPFI